MSLCRCSIFVSGSMLLFQCLSGVGWSDPTLALPSTGSCGDLGSPSTLAAVSFTACPPSPLCQTSPSGNKLIPRVPLLHLATSLPSSSSPANQTCHLQITLATQDHNANRHPAPTPVLTFFFTVLIFSRKRKVLKSRLFQTRTQSVP